MPANTPVEPTALEAESADALAAMEAEATEFFASRNAELQAAALNPVAAALDAAEKPAAAAPRASTRAKQAASAAESASVKATPKPAGTATTAKIPGAPTLRPAAEKDAAVSSPTAAPSADTNATDQSDPNAPDISDIPKEYKPGSTRAPQWDKLRANRDHYEALSVQRHQEIENLRAELEQIRAARAAAEPTPEVAQRLATIQKERDELEARLQAVAVEKSPRFEAQFKPRRDAAFAQAKAAVGPEAAAQIESILAMPESSFRDEQIGTLLESLPTLRATKLSQAVADLDRLTTERQQLAAQGSELWKTWTAEESAARDRANAERHAKANATFEAELKEWAPVGLTADEVAAARSVYSGQGTTLQDASRAALWAVAGPRAAQMVQELQARNAELEGEVKKLRGAQPGVGAAGGGALPSGASDDDDPDITSYADRIAKQAARNGVRFGV